MIILIWGGGVGGKGLLKFIKQDKMGGGGGDVTEKVRRLHISHFGAKKRRGGGSPVEVVFWGGGGAT